MNQLKLDSSAQDRLLFEVNWLSERVKNLELIVHELLRGRINKELADSWVSTANDRGFLPTIGQIEGRGKQIADLLDIWPADKFESSVWPEKPNPIEK